MDVNRTLFSAAKALGLIIERTLGSGSLLVISPEGARKVWNPFLYSDDVLALISEFNISFSHTDDAATGKLVEASSGDYRVVEPVEGSGHNLALIRATVRLAALFEDRATKLADVKDLSLKLVSLQAQVAFARQTLEEIGKDPALVGDGRIAEALHRLDTADAPLALLDWEREEICECLSAEGYVLAKDLVQARRGLPSILTN